MIHLLALSRRQFVKVAIAVGASILGVLRIGAAEPRGNGQKHACAA